MGVAYDNGIFSVEDVAGAVLAGAKLYFYTTGTSTPLATYSDQALTTPNANPVIADANGRFGAIWLQTASYKVVLKTSADVTIVTRDPVRGDVDVGLTASLAATTGSSLVGFLQSGTGAVATTVQARLRQTVSVLDYIPTNLHAGIRDGSNTTTVEAYIQAAIDAINTAGGGGLHFPMGTYLCDVVNYLKDDLTVSGITCFKLRDNVDLVGDGFNTIVKVKNGAYGGGAFFRIVSSRDATMLSNASIRNMQFDGNKANQTASVQCSNIVLECLSNVTIENVWSKNANGNGILLRGTTATYASNLKVINCTDSGSAYIGIQVSQFDGLVIAGNHVSGSADNAIDIYGEDGTANCHGRNFVIANNNTNGGTVGIFCETVRRGTVIGNNVAQASAIGIVVNRINGQPNNINIMGNSVNACPTGLRITGDTGGISIRGNFFDGFSTSGVRLGGGGNVSYVDVSDNYFTPANNTTEIIGTAGTVASFCTGRHNTVNSSGITTAYLFAAGASTNTDITIDGFKVLPAQVGYDYHLRKPLIVQADMLGASAANTAGPVDVTITDGTAGIVYVTARQGGTGNSWWEVPYVKYGGTLTLGTARTTFQTADPITGVSVSSNNLRITLGAANSYVNYTLFRQAISG